MNVRQLHVLRMTIQTGSVSETARRLNLSQPAISKILGAIESDLGLRLFNRANGRVSPTFEAQQLLPEIDRILGEVTSLRDRAADLREGRAGLVRIVCSSVLATLLVTPAIAEFQRENPKVRFEARVVPTSMMFERVRNNQADLALTQPFPDDTLTIAETLCSGRLVCVVRAEHHLAQAPVVTPAELIGERIITFPQGSPSGDKVRSAFQSAGHRLETTVDVDLALFAAALVRANVGVGIVDSLFSFDMFFPDLRLIAFEPELKLSICALASRFRPLPPTVRQFLTTLKGVAKARIVEGNGVLPYERVNPA